MLCILYVVAIGSQIPPCSLLTLSRNPKSQCILWHDSDSWGDELTSEYTQNGRAVQNVTERSSLIGNDAMTNPTNYTGEGQVSTNLRKELNSSAPSNPPPHPLVGPGCGRRRRSTQEAGEGGRQGSAGAGLRSHGHMHDIRGGERVRGGGARNESTNEQSAANIAPSRIVALSARRFASRFARR